jgi:hypothetical protein
MRGRNILILVVVLALLVVVAIYFETSRRASTQTSDALLFPGLDTELVDRIQILSEGEETILEKQGDQWIVNTEGGFPAEPRLVNDILDRLPKFYADQVVSTNPENRNLFQVDSSGVEVWIQQAGEEIGHFIVGKPGPDFLSTYVRAADSDEVIQVPEYLPSLFKSQKTWREKTIFDLNLDDVQSYEYDSPTKGHLLVTRGQPTGWEVKEPETGLVDDEQIIRTAVQSFCRLRATDFADTLTAEDAGIEADTTWIEATLADGSIHKVRFGLPTERNRNFARKEGSRHIVLIPRGAINTMMPPFDAIPLRPMETEVEMEAQPDAQPEEEGGE